MASTSETVPVGHVGFGTTTETGIQRFGWTPPRVRRLVTSSAEGSSGLGPDAELIS